MKEKQAKKLFTKYLNNECSAEELVLLHRFLDSFQDKDQIWPVSEYGEEADLKKKMWQRIKVKANNGKQKKSRVLGTYFKYAAVLLALVGIAFLFEQSDKNDVKNDILIEDEAITLKLEGNVIKKINTDGSESLLDKDGKIIGEQNKNLLVYKNDRKAEKLVYNEISVPNGKKFELVLSDGTSVHLNSGTSLRYPMRFLPGHDRQVFLKGEAYFEVAKDARHPFLVHTDNMGIKVLGTHFNVSSYKNTNTFAVLVEGSVAVYRNDGTNTHGVPRIIGPGQKASLAEKNIKVDNVNTDDYLGWREGKLIFHDESFKNIVDKIERKYNVKIQNRYVQLNDIRFNGKFEDETILDLLDTFKESAEFEYQIIDNEIIMNKP